MAAPRKPAASTRGAVVKDDPKKRGGAVMSIEDRLAADAEKAAEQERGGGLGKSFSFKGGILAFDGAPIKGNKIAVIIAASKIEKAFYEGRYDPNNPEPPVCYALADDPDELAPDPDKVAELQHDECASCPLNQWGSADTGRGKACKDVRRLFLLPAGTIAKGGDIELIQDPKLIEKAEGGFAKLPPTSLNAFAAYVKSLSSTMRRPPHGVFTLIEVEPDDTNQFRITFEALDLIEDKKMLEAVFKRHDEALELLAQPYTYPTEEQKAERKKQNNRPGARKPAANARGANKPAGRGTAAKAGAPRRKY